MKKDSIELELKVDTKELDETLKKAKELKNTLEEVNNLINSIANNQSSIVSINGRNLAKATYEYYKNEVK